MGIGVAEQRAHRKLAAILSADVVGYSRLMGDAEAATVETLTAHRQIFFGEIGEHGGRVVDSPGDNLLAEFASPVDAVECAAKVQRALEGQNAKLSDDRRMESPPRVTRRWPGTSPSTRARLPWRDTTCTGWRTKDSPLS